MNADLVKYCFLPEVRVMCMEFELQPYLMKKGEGV